MWLWTVYVNPRRQLNTSQKRINLCEKNDIYIILRCTFRNTSIWDTKRTFRMVNTFREEKLVRPMVNREH